MNLDVHGKVNTSVKDTEKVNEKILIHDKEKYREMLFDAAEQF